MGFIILIILLAFTIMLLLSFLKDKKACNLAKNKVKELSSYTAEHIQALELEGISVSDDLEVQKAKVQKLKKKVLVKLVSIIVLAVLLFIII